MSKQHIWCTIFVPHKVMYLSLIGAEEIGLSTLSGVDNSLPFLMDDVGCSGNEVRLIDCDHETIHDCIRLTEEVAVHCNRNG